MQRKTALLVVVGVLIISILACSSGAKTPTSQPPVTGITPQSQPGSGLTLVNKSAFTDQYDTYHVVGLVKNDSSTVVTSVELTVEIKDASGNSLLKDDNGAVVPTEAFATLLNTLAPGESSPFEYTYDTTGGTPASYDVTITGQQTGDANRADVTVENVEFFNDQSGTLYVTGELVNNSSGWAQINGLAGAAVDSAGNVLSAGWSATYATDLAPTGDANGMNRTPFQIDFYDPASGTPDWQVYADADLIDEPTRYQVSLELTNGYFDDSGSFHLVGLLTNDETQSMSTLMIAGLYGADNKVMDADWKFSPIYLAAGASVPFDISGFTIVNWNASQAAKLDSYTAQFDRDYTFPTTRTFVALTTANDVVEKNGSTWTVSGDVTNSSGQALSDITVVVAVLDADNKVVATDYTYLTPEGDTFANGATTHYDVTLYLNPSEDTSSYTFQTIVQGDVP